MTQTWGCAINWRRAYLWENTVVLKVAIHQFTVSKVPRALLMQGETSCEAPNSLSYIYFVLVLSICQSIHSSVCPSACRSASQVSQLVSKNWICQMPDRALFSQPSSLVMQCSILTRKARVYKCDFYLQKISGKQMSCRFWNVSLRPRFVEFLWLSIHAPVHCKVQLTWLLWFLVLGKKWICRTCDQISYET